MQQHIKKDAEAKPDRPFPDFPLFPHATRRWAKKIRGKMHYFGPWNDPNGALEKYDREKTDLYAGRVPRPAGDGLTIKALCNRFLTSKQHLRDSGEIAPRTFKEYNTATDRIVAAFGTTRLVSDLTPEDFEKFRADLAKTRGPVSVKSAIGWIRTDFKFAVDARLIDRPVYYGRSFDKPSRVVLRKARLARGPRLMTPEELRKTLEAASPHMRAMIHLALNCGFGNTDLGTLPKAALDLTRGWVDYPRPKTAIPRRVPLWPETITALQEAITRRHAARDPADDGLVFLTRTGRPWVRFSNNNATDCLSIAFGLLLTDLKIKRPGLNFYALRHIFETIAGENLDQVAVNAIMGHAPPAGDMASVYRERISDERLKAVTNHVRAWLLGTTAPE